MRKAALVIVPVLILLIGGGFMVLKNKKPVQTPVEPPSQVESIPVVELAKNNPYGVDLKPRLDKRAVFLKVATFPPGLKSIEYELTYESKEGTRGVLGTINYKSEVKIQREILLGTCSKNICRYDEGVTKVNLTIVFRGEKTEKFQGNFSLE